MGHTIPSIDGHIISVSLEPVAVVEQTCSRIQARADAAAG
jgi:hypothetical protein